MMVGCPVAGELGLGSSAGVASLVNDSPLPAAPVKLTLTFTVNPFSSSVRA